MKREKKASKLQLIGRVVIYAVPFWFAIVLLLGIMDRKDVRLQALILALAFAIFVVVDKNLPDSQE
ncbi:MAG TPA: hypothetical protein VLH84_03425 [Patescibacteria group bacterium]|nr:hypothetical protein [Patescibacteria group bacterium]